LANKHSWFPFIDKPVTDNLKNRYASSVFVVSRRATSHAWHDDRVFGHIPLAQPIRVNWTFSKCMENVGTSSYFDTLGLFNILMVNSANHIIERVTFGNVADSH
jgi:hypothetical protein